MTVFATGFTDTKPVSSAQGRYGELILAQGGGVQPKRWAGVGAASNAGIPAPAAAPTITPNTTKRYYVARTDVHTPGAVYNAPPEITYSTPAVPPTGFRAAKAKAYLNQSVVSEVRMTDGGKFYPDPPSISLSSTHGKNAVLTAILDGTPPDATSITHYEVTQGPPYDDETDYSAMYRTKWEAWGAVDIPLTNGSGTVSRTVWVYHNACGAGPGDLASYLPIALALNYTVSGATGTGAIASVNFYGQRVTETQCNAGVPFVLCATSCFVRSVTAKSAGSGYDPDDPVTITIPASVTLDTTTGTMTTTVPANRNLIIEGYPPGHAKNTSTPRFAIKEIAITNGGSGYVVAPNIKIVSSSGFGAYATCQVTNGAITQVTLESGGGGYKLVPQVIAVAGGAEAFAVARPHLRGKYQCYYRYVDSTSADKGGPIPSSLSPVTEIDTAEGAQSLGWTVAAPGNTNRATKAELWRSTGDQAVMLYRVKTIESFSGSTATFTDDLTDDELRDPDRTGYAALPIVLPNGDLNAMRFTPPPNSKAVVVRYQDRFWYGVDTSGTEPNSIYFSEVDEPESVPDINEFVLQQNAKDSDAIAALVPFGATMLVMQSRRAYSLSFSKHPLRDADVTPLAYRGCVGQRCWDVHNGLCYLLDKRGVYTISSSGEVRDLSAPIDDIVRTQIDWANSTWNFVVVDPAKKILRVFVALKGDSSAGYPTCALCFSIDTGAWWMERYPIAITGGAVVPLPNGDNRCVVATPAGMYVLDSGTADAATGAIAKVTITNKGAGYRTPPTVTASGGSGAELQAAINADGQVSGIWILSPGYGYSAGSLAISAPDDPDCAAPVQAVAAFTTITGSMFPTYRYKSGNRPFQTDVSARDSSASQSRDISVTYKPQDSACQLAMRLYYNNSPYARPNVAYRNRGAGFASGTVDGASRIDMSRLTTKTGYDSGVAKATFSGRTLDDLRSGDRHVAVELLGAATSTSPVVIYAMDVYGTSSGGG